MRSLKHHLLPVLLWVLLPGAACANATPDAVLSAVLDECMTQRPFDVRFSALRSSDWEQASENYDLEMAASAFALFEMGLTLKAEGKITPSVTRAFNGSRKKLLFQLTEPTKPFIKKALLQFGGHETEATLFMRQVSNNGILLSECIMLDPTERDVWFITEFSRKQARKTMIGTWELPRTFDRDSPFNSTGTALWIDQSIAEQFVAAGNVPSMIYGTFSILAEE